MKNKVLFSTLLIFLCAAAVRWWGQVPPPVVVRGGQPAHLSAAFYASTSPSGEERPILWVIGGLDRVGPNDPPGSTVEAKVKGGRREYVDFQLVVRAPAGGLTNVNIIASDLKGPEDAILSSSHYTLYREHYVTFETGSPDYGPSAGNRPLPPGTYPDPLIPFNDPQTGVPLSGNGAALQAVPFNLAGGHNQPIWCDLFIPPGTAPGKYSGTMRVTSDQGASTVQVALTVWNFELPLVPSEKTLFLIFDNTRGPVEANQKTLLRNKIMPRQIWDASRASSYVSDFGLNRAGLLYYGDSTCSTMGPAPSVSDIQSQVSEYPPGLTLDIQPADEISGCTAIYPTVKQWAQNAHAAGVSIVITMKPDPALYDDGSGTGRAAVDHWVMLPKQWPSTLAGIPGTVWSYNACEQDGYSPKWQIDFLPINYRIQAGFLNQTQGATGLLYWAVDYWPHEDMWSDVLVSGCDGSWPGEGLLIYPAAKIGSSEPAPSMRLKFLRDGIQDYEYVEMLKQLGHGTWALTQASTIAQDWAVWSKSAPALAAVRDVLGQKLSDLASEKRPRNQSRAPQN